MRNLSFYIAKRYNSHTLLISMLLIVICSFLVGTLIYIGENFYLNLRDLIFDKSELSFYNLTFLYASTVGYLLFLLGLVWLIFKKFLSKFRPKSKLILTFVLSMICLLTGVGSVFLNFEDNLIGNFVTSILFSTSLLSFTFTLLSLILGKKRITGVNIITSIAVFAITIATCSLFVILSVFSGLEKMNLQFLNDVNPDIKISPSKGKILTNIDEITSKLDQQKEIVSYAKVIEEKVSIEFDDKQDITYIKGVDSKFREVVKIDTAIIAGNFLNFNTDYQFVASDGVARRLQMYIDYKKNAKLMMPKPGTGLISSEDEAFNSAFANPIGVFFINEQYDKYILAPIGLTQNLLRIPTNSAYSIEIKLNHKTKLDSYKNDLQKVLGNQYKVETRHDLDATFLKVMNVENLITYLIFTLVIIIASFNLAGAIIIIIIDKTKQIKSMWSFGIPKSHIKQIFFNTGLLITGFSILFGLILGSVLGVLQNNFGLVMANPIVPFPFNFTIQNYLIVSMTVLLIGGTVSYLVSRKLPNIHNSN